MPGDGSLRQRRGRPLSFPDNDARGPSPLWMRAARLLPLLPLLWMSACTTLESDDARSRQALARFSEAGFEVELDGGGRLEVPPGRISGMAVTAVPVERGRLLASGRISAEGRLDGTPFSYLGDERFSVSCTGTCEVVDTPAPEMAAVLKLLRERRRALSAGDSQALRSLATEAGLLEIDAGDLLAAAGRLPLAWFIRVDRDVAIVGEAAEEGGQKRIVLQREEGQWRFVSGLP